jgi:hypothetical protein
MEGWGLIKATLVLIVTGILLAGLTIAAGITISKDYETIKETAKYKLSKFKDDKNREYYEYVNKDGSLQTIREIINTIENAK